MIVPFADIEGIADQHCFNFPFYKILYGQLYLGSSVCLNISSLLIECPLLNVQKHISCIFRTRTNSISKKSSRDETTEVSTFRSEKYVKLCRGK